jgi:hypothetical protein
LSSLHFFEDKYPTGKNLKLLNEHHQRMVEEARQWSEYHSKDAAKERSKQKRINKEKIIYSVKKKAKFKT